MVTQKAGIEQALKFVKDCEQNGLEFHKVLLFGSYAVNQMNEYSDIDLILVSDKFTSNRFTNLDLYLKSNVKYPLVEVHSYPTSIYKLGTAFINEIKPTAIQLR